MRIPKLEGVIRRRILVNFRVAPEAVERILPAPFRPKLLGDAAIAGICLIRLEAIRPRALPAAVGISSENAAHRVAVCWTDQRGEEREGVYIPRRDTSSRLNHLAGGRIFPGEHHRATFEIDDRGDTIDFGMESVDGEVKIELRGRAASGLPSTSKFGSLAEASAFFEKGSLGYSATSDASRLDGLSLVTKQWRVEPLHVEHAFSSFFSDPARFAAGTVELDCALVMRDIEHEWHDAPDLAVRRRTE
jgi:hypothetical protein